MASSFTTSYGIEKIATGEQSGSWGTTTNYNIDILDRIAAYKSVALSDASTATLTVRAGSQLMELVIFKTVCIEL